MSGSGLLEIPDAGGGTKNFYTLVAEELAKRLKVDPPQKNTGERALNEVVCKHLEELRSWDEDLHWDVKEVVEQLEQSVPIPKALYDLAALPVKLFVTTTFDNLLARAIEQRHPVWKGKIRQIEYSPARKDDLDSIQLSDGPPVVFHLFGRATSMPEYAVTEEDVLEFMHALQSQEGRPENLFRLLQQKNLLIVGCGFEDWFARFFIRLGVKDRLIAVMGKTDWFVECDTSTSEFAMFLKHYSHSTKHFPLGPVEFIARLVGKLPQDLAHTTIQRLQATPRDPVRDILEGAVFLSYASEDRDIVERMKQELDSNGIDCWFDQQQLKTGDDWESKIIRNVNACGLFLVILSRKTLTPEDRFFRSEWHEAFNRSIRFPANAKFLIPVAIDDIQPDPALPLRLVQANWERLPGGIVTSEFIEMIKAAYRQAQLRMRGSTL
ncbi:MAG: toll/interleukin-1 receptor domain-containing protein [Proteobacteria bacterium]|nr:toll/interleukin-1 receptor domain-containing protein [Pseudomonadota bacterium]